MIEVPDSRGVLLICKGNVIYAGLNPTSAYNWAVSGTFLNCHREAFFFGRGGE